jgi:DNA mismatch repair protein PMS2
MDVIEVADNGCGVPLQSRSLMATKHATSKIRSFQDLYEDKDGGEKGLTLGFRGEALFCLANLSQNLVVSTKTMNDTVGQRMHFRTFYVIQSFLFGVKIYFSRPMSKNLATFCFFSSE